MVNRRLRDAGIKPVLACVLLLSGFVGFSVYLFSKTSFVVYVYGLIAPAIAARFSERRRNEFLILCFGDRKAKKIRIAENLVVAVPFVLFLCYKQLFLFALASIVLSVLSAFGTSRAIAQTVMPTPFYKKPFEFAVGFRNTYLLFLVAYALTVIALAVNNFNLGIFSLLFVFAVTLGYYTQPEPEYYVWVHKYNPQQFLWNKIRTALVFSSLLCLPVVLSLIVFYPGHTGITLVFYVISCTFLTAVVLAKYAAYPNEINLVQSILLGLSIPMPFLLLAVVPYFYYTSVKRLNHLLV